MKMCAYKVEGFSAGTWLKPSKRTYEHGEATSMTNATTDSLQAQLIAAQRIHILEAAAKTFAAKGFHGTTVKEVAQEAGIATGTIYNYFENKEALLMGIFAQMRAQVMQEAELPALADVDLPSFLTAFLAYPMRGMRDDNFAMLRVVISELFINPKLNEKYQQQIHLPTLAVAEEYLRARMEQVGGEESDVPLLVRVASALVMGLAVQAALGDELIVAQWEQLPARLAALLVNGIGTRGSSEAGEAAA
jgi:TetR/AcrR family fatty acid metabolism transcriptional regulator